ncbi:hypothetical protein T492DRAFT_850493 [Pavlovales sp. CCMP2436]|nr:hypothetical protein T492DRAFT_850493 [Pavlovales sp. CCMP2436]
MNGWGCDCLSKDGYILLVVRPITQADVPAGVTVPERKKLRRLLPSARVEAVIDVLVEPLSASSVRFAYSLTIPLASTVPAWAVNFILSEACANIFSNMREQAKKMAAQSPDSAHLKQAQTAEGRVLTAWLDARIDPYVAVLSGRA